MPEFKREIAKTDFKPTGTTVHGDAMAQFKASAAQTISDTAMGIGAGYAAGTAERSIGADESYEDASAYVQQGFQAAAPVKSGFAVFNDEAPSREALEEQRQKFLNEAQLTHKRMLSAREQGIMSTSEMDNRVVMDRKQVANNPFKAMFLPEYDKIMGGGASGSARGSYFGQTAQEKAQEKAYVTQLTKQMEDEMLEDRMMQANSDLSREQARGIRIGMENEAMLAEGAKNRIAIRQGDNEDRAAVFHHDMGKPMTQLNVQIRKLVGTPGGVKAGDLNEIRVKTSQLELAALDRLHSSGITDASVLDKEDKLIKAQFKHYRKMIEDNDYATQLTQVTEERAAEIALLKTTKARNYVVNNPAILAASAIDSLGGNIPTVVDLLLNVDTLASKIKNKEGSMAWEFLKGLKQEQRMMTIGEALTNMYGPVQPGEKPPPEETRDLAGGLMEQSGSAKMTLENWKLDPEGATKKFRGYNNIPLGEMFTDSSWQKVIQEVPEMGTEIIKAAAMNSVPYQMQNGGEKPISLKVISPEQQEEERAAKEMNREPVDVFASGGIPKDDSRWENYRSGSVNPVSGKKIGNNILWKFESLDEEGNKVELDDAYKRSLIGAYKWAAKYPEVYKDYGNIHIFIESLFAYKKGGTQQRLFNELVASEEAAKLEPKDAKE